MSLVTVLELKSILSDIGIATFALFCFYMDYLFLSFHFEPMMFLKLK